MRWLSRGNALVHFIELLDKIISFLNEHGKDTRRLQKASFQCDLAFLTDITGHLNFFNTKLQGRFTTQATQKNENQDIDNILDEFGNIFNFDYFNISKKQCFYGMYIHSRNIL